MTVLEVDALHAHYGKSHILHGVSLTVGAGEIVCLLGRNGVGKSTTLKSLMGLVKPSAGSVTFKGQDITGLPPTGWRGSGSATCPRSAASSPPSA